MIAFFWIVLRERVLGVEEVVLTEVTRVGRAPERWRHDGCRMAKVAVERDLAEPNWLSEMGGFAGIVIDEG
jgi:hypothetical protein